MEAEGTMNYDATHRKTAKEERNKQKRKSVCGMTRTTASAATKGGRTCRRTTTMRCLQTKAAAAGASQATGANTTSNLTLF